MIMQQISCIIFSIFQQLILIKFDIENAQQILIEGAGECEEIYMPTVVA